MYSSGDNFAITTSHLSKQYNDGTQAVHPLDLTVPRSRIFSIVGPNGAGKTTLLRMLGTQLTPTGGSATILGFDLMKQTDGIRAQIASVPQEATAYPELSSWDHVCYYLMARGVSYRVARRRTEEALVRVGLWDVRRKVSENLSGGMRHRILIAMAVASGARLMFLDEPTAGLDPLARREFWETIVSLRTSTTVVITTHLMEEAEALSDHVVILNKGRKIASGSPDELKATISAGEKVIFEDEVDRVEMEGFGRVAMCAGKVQVYPHSAEQLKNLLARAVSQVVAFSVKPVSLEDVFVKCIEDSDEEIH